MRFWSLLVAGCATLFCACTLDWDSLRAGGDPFDASDDVGSTDTGLAWPRDSAHPAIDAEQPDTSDPADGSSDDGGADSSIVDTSVPDTSIPDTSIVDTSVPDTSVVDSGSLCSFIFTGTLATYDFTGEPGNQGSTAAKSSASGITAGNVGRSGSIVAQAGSNSINGSSWSTGSTVDGTRYYTLILTPAAKCAIDLTSVSIDTKASGTGPANGAIATSDDSFVKNTTFATSSVTTVSISVTGSTTAVEIRIYGYKASSSSGTLRVQTTLSVSGALK